MQPEHALARPRLLKVAAVVAVAFGIATVFSGGRVLFGPESARAGAGAYVPFVLWFNSVAGFAYVVAGAGLWSARVWAARLAVAIAATTALVYAAFGVHIALGGTFERRTVVAMALRTGLWTLIAWMASRKTRT